VDLSRRAVAVAEAVREAQEAIARDFAAWKDTAN